MAGNNGWYWFDKYKDKGIYNKNDQISTKAAKTRNYINEQEDLGMKKTTQRLENARKKREGNSTDQSEVTRKKVEKVFRKAREGRF